MWMALKRVLSIATICLAAWATAGSFTASAQQVGIKTNLLYDATASINLGLEIALARNGP